MIQVKLGKAGRELQDLDAINRLADALRIAKVMAKRIKARLAKGETATPPKPYKAFALERTTTRRSGAKGQSRVRAVQGPNMQRRRGYRISPAYAKSLGLDRTVFNSSAEFHTAAGTRPGTFSVTGGMQSGLQVRSFGTNGSLIDYGGSSLGAKSVKSAKTRSKRDEAGAYVMKTFTDPKTGRTYQRRVRELRRDAAGAVRYNTTPVLVRNSDKAGIVFRHSRIGLLQPTDTETIDLADAVADAMNMAVVRCLGGGAQNIERTSGNSSALHDEFMRALSPRGG